MAEFILYSIAVFLVTILFLVVLLLVAKKYLSPSGKVKITINGEKELEVEQGGTILATLNENGVHLPSACEVKEAAVSVSAKYWKEAEKYSIRNAHTSLVKR